MLPQGYLHSPTTCHGLVVKNISTQKGVCQGVALHHCIDDTMLTGHLLAILPLGVGESSGAPRRIP